MPVIRGNTGEVTAGAQMVHNGVCHKYARICRPAMIFVKADLLGSSSVNDWPLS
jgi:hypothetical protein